MTINHAVRRLDRRLLIIYVTITVALALMLSGLTIQANSYHHQNVRFERQIALNCQSVVAGNSKFNAALKQLETNALNTKGLTDAQKQQAIAAYSGLFLAVPQCPTAP